MHETIWFDKYKFDEAEEKFQAHLAGVSVASPSAPVKTQGASTCSQSVKEIAEARRKIQQTLNAAPSSPSSSTQSTGGDKRVAELEAENKRLVKVTDDLSAALKKLEIRVAQLEAGKPAAQVQAVAPAKDQKPAPPADDDSDSDDLFGSSDEEDNAEKERIKAERVAAYNARKANKKVVIAKSSILLDVKPWADDTDLVEMEKLVRAIEMDGLLWGASKLVPVAFGVKKLQISCVVEDLKVSTDDLSDQIEGFEDHVQSVDIAAFNKI